MFEAFNNYADFSGRASRSEFWLFQLLNIIALLFICPFILMAAAERELSELPFLSSGC